VAEEIIERLKLYERNLRLNPCIVASKLLGIREEINGLPYNDFEKVLYYVRNSSLPPDFKEDLEVEYSIRNTLPPR
jgi:hypothetical protein